MLWVHWKRPEAEQMGSVTPESRGEGNGLVGRGDVDLRGEIDSFGIQAYQIPMAVGMLLSIAQARAGNRERSPILPRLCPRLRLCVSDVGVRQGRFA